MYVVVIIIHQNVDVASWLYNGVSHAVLYQGGSTYGHENEASNGVNVGRQ